MINLKHVSRTFTQGDRDYSALTHVNLHITSGEHVVIVGKSGSGKSTLLNLITGIDRPSAGTVTVGGTDLAGLNESDLARWRGKNIGIVFQFFQLIPTLTIAENLILPMEFVNVIPKKERWERALSLLDLVDIADHAHKFPTSLSGGEQQRAAIARAMANNPDILIADEPTGNLDSKTADSIRGIFNRLVAVGKTLIVVTHDSLEGQVFDQFITLQDGRVVSTDLDNAKNRDVI